MLINKKTPLVFSALEIMTVAFIFMLEHTYAFVHFTQFPDVDLYSTNEWEYVYILIVVAVVIIYLLWQNQLTTQFINAWKSNKFLVLFLVYAILSILWTVHAAATQYKLIYLMFSTLAGSYIAVRYGLENVLKLFVWIGGVISILSILFVIFIPVGIMRNDPFVGSWVGIFWHRNHTGNLFAYFNMLFLIRFLQIGNENKLQKVILSVFYIMSGVIIFGSRSATGIIIFFFLNFVVGLVFFWLKLNHLMKPRHYFIAAGLLLGGFLIFVLNTSFFFGLLGRESSMTGRVPLWVDLFQNFYILRPWFGYGYGALWMQESFRNLMQLRHGWKYPVFFADNGFFDILLNLGLIGLLLFFIVYFSMGVHGFNQGIRKKTLVAFFPFLTFIYLIVGNLTYSFLLEVDQFVWMILIVMVFLTAEESLKT